MHAFATARLGRGPRGCPPAIRGQAGGFPCQDAVVGGAGLPVDFRTPELLKRLRPTLWWGALLVLPIRVVLRIASKFLLSRQPSRHSPCTCVCPCPEACPDADFVTRPTDRPESRARGHAVSCVCSACAPNTSPGTELERLDLLPGWRFFQESSGGHSRGRFHGRWLFSLSSVQWVRSCRVSCLAPRTLGERLPVLWMQVLAQ